MSLRQRPPDLTPIVAIILEVLNGWLPPDDVDLDDPHYLVDAAADVASRLRPEPTNDPRVWKIFLIDRDQDLLRTIRDAGFGIDEPIPE
jgi:hypothetical protein